MAEGSKINEKQEWVKLAFAVLMGIAGVALLIVGMVMPPLGVIDTSIIIASGEVFVFSASVLGIKLSYDLRIAKLAQALKTTDTDKDS